MSRGPPNGRRSEGMPGTGRGTVVIHKYKDFSLILFMGSVL